MYTNRSFSMVTVLCLLVLVLAAAAAPASATETKPIYGARAYAMGGAFTAVADDVSALFHNPAGLKATSFGLSLNIGSNNPTEALQTQSILADLGALMDEQLSLDLIAMSGVTIGGFGGGIAVEANIDTDIDGCAPAWDFCADGEYTARIAAGMAFKPPFIPSANSMDWGITAQRLLGGRSSFRMEEGAASYETELTEYSGQGFGIGLGLLWKALPMIDFGVAADNLFSQMTWNGTQTITEFDLNDQELNTTTTTLAAKSEALPPVIRVGAALRPPLPGTTIAADIDNNGTLRLGAETGLLFSGMSVRAGQIMSVEETMTTLGLGFKFGPVALDLASQTEDFKDFGLVLEGSVRF